MKQNNWTWRGVSVSIEVAPLFYLGGLGVAVRESADTMNNEGQEIAIIVPFMFEGDLAEKFREYRQNNSNGQPDFVLKYRNKVHNIYKECKVLLYDDDSVESRTKIYAIKEDSMCSVLRDEYGGYANTSAECQGGDTLCYSCALSAFNSVAADFIVELNRSNQINLVITHDWLTATTFSVLHARHPEFYHDIHKIFFLHNKYDSEFTIENATNMFNFEEGYLEKNISSLADGIHLADVVFANSQFCTSLIDADKDNAMPKPYIDSLVWKIKMHRVCEMHHGIIDCIEHNKSSKNSVENLSPQATGSRTFFCPIHSSALNVNGLKYQTLKTINEDDFREYKQNNKRTFLSQNSLVGSDNNLVLSWVGRFDVSQKGFWMVIDKVHEILDDFSDVTLVLLGVLPKNDTNLLNKLREELGDLAEKYSGRVFVKPYRKKCYSRHEIAQALAGSDFLLMPSVYEPFGLSCFEAMSMGCIPIVHPVDGLRDTVNYSQEKQIAIVMEQFDAHKYEKAVTSFEWRDPINTQNNDIANAHEKFKKAILNALKFSDEERVRIALNGIRYVQKKHNWSAIYNQYYQKALKKLRSVHRANMASYIYGKPKARLLADHPICEDANHLFFGADEWSSALASLALNRHNKTPFAVVIDGEWGRGKTTLLKQIQRKVINESKSSTWRSKREYRKVETIWFNVWKYPEEGSMLTGLVCALFENIAARKQKHDDNQNAKDKIKNIVTSVIDTVKKRFPSLAKHTVCALISAAPGFGPTIAEHLSSIEFTEDKNDGKNKPDSAIVNQRGLYSVFEEMFKELLKQYQDDDSILAVFLDDLDRCKSEQILSALETINLFVGFEGVCFFFGVDFERVKSACALRYKEKADQENFLEKFMQVHITLAPIAPIVFREFVSEVIHDPDLKMLINNKYLDSIVSSPRMRNPRRIKLFLNDLGVRMAAIESFHLMDASFNKEQQADLKSKLQRALVEFLILKEFVDSELWPAITYSCETLHAFIHSKSDELRKAINNAEFSLQEPLNTFLEKQKGDGAKQNFTEGCPCEELGKLELNQLQYLINGIF